MNNDTPGTLTSGDAPDHVSTILGVVYPPGAAGARLKGQADWTLRCTLQPWRVEGGTLQEAPLALSQNLSADDLKRLMALLHSYRIVQALVRFRQPGNADLVGLLSTAAHDRELEQLASALQVPVLRDDPLFGSLTFNRSLAWWEAKVSWAKQSVTLHLSAETLADLDAVLVVAHSLWNDQAAWDTRVREYAVRYLLDLKNASWLDDEETPLSAEQFLNRIALESISVDAEGTFSFMYDDGDLFLGHVIEVSGSLQTGPTHAGIAG
jgi:hypothetical protein